MIWPFKRKPPCDEMLEAKAASIQARLEKSIANQKYYDITKQSDHLENINRRNHISESLTRAFGGPPS